MTSRRMSEKVSRAPKTRSGSATTDTQQGWTGSMSLSFAATSGNTDLSINGRFRYGEGTCNHAFGFALDLVDDNDNRTRAQGRGLTTPLIL